MPTYLFPHRSQVANRQRATFGRSPVRGLGITCFGNHLKTSSSLFFGQTRWRRAALVYKSGSDVGFPQAKRTDISMPVSDNVVPRWFTSWAAMSDFPKPSGLTSVCQYQFLSHVFLILIAFLWVTSPSIFPKSFIFGLEAISTFQPSISLLFWQPNKPMPLWRAETVDRLLENADKTTSQHSTQEENLSMQVTATASTRHGRLPPMSGREERALRSRVDEHRRGIATRGEPGHQKKMSSEVPKSSSRAHSRAKSQNVARVQAMRYAWTHADANDTTRSSTLKAETNGRQEKIARQVRQAVEASSRKQVEVTGRAKTAVRCHGCGRTFDTDSQLRSHFLYCFASQEDQVSWLVKQSCTRKAPFVNIFTQSSWKRQNERKFSLLKLNLKLFKHCKRSKINIEYCKLFCIWTPFFSSTVNFTISAKSAMFTVHACTPVKPKWFLTVCDSDDHLYT